MSEKESKGILSSCLNIDLIVTFLSLPYTENRPILSHPIPVKWSHGTKSALEGGELLCNDEKN